MIDLILLDMKMARMDRQATLKALKDTIHAAIPVIVLTAFSSVKTAVKAMREGTFDYVAKPIDLDELKMVMAKALHFQELKQENSRLKKDLEERFSFGNIIGISPAMEELFETLELVAPSDATVLITGESGTGKELIANAIYQQSNRKPYPFIKKKKGSPIKRPLVKTYIRRMIGKRRTTL